MELAKRVLQCTVLWATSPKATPFRDAPRVAEYAAPAEAAEEMGGPTDWARINCESDGAEGALTLCAGRNCCEAIGSGCRISLCGLAALGGRPRCTGRIGALALGDTARPTKFSSGSRCRACGDIGETALPGETVLPRRSATKRIDIGDTGRCPSSRRSGYIIPGCKLESENSRFCANTSASIAVCGGACAIVLDTAPPLHLQLEATSFADGATGNRPTTLSDL